MCCGEGTHSVLCRLGCPVHSDKNCERFRRGYGPTYNRLRGVVFEWMRVIVDSDVVVTLVPCHVVERVVLGVDRLCERPGSSPSCQAPMCECRVS